MATSKEKDAHRVRSEQIKADLRSISTCTAETVRELQELLAPPTEKENVRAKGPQVRNAAAETRGRPATGRKLATTTTTTATTAKTAAYPSPRDRYILATEVANASLKSLADALKVQPTRKTEKSRTPPTTTSEIKQAPGTARRTLSRAESCITGQKPLQERSASQVTNSPVKPTSLRRSLSYSSCLTTGPDPGLVATAECARSAFGYLRSPEAAKTAGKDTPALQLENGIMALVGKLVAHGLDSLAIKECRVLKKRLDLYLEKNGGAKATKAKEGVKKSSVGEERESLASLLEFGEVDQNSPALSVVVGLQTYVLRVIARVRRPRLVEETWGCLKLNNPSSPANLLWRIAKNSKGDSKAIRQLESLAQAVLALCPSISRSEDPSADQNQLQPPPDVVLSLQHLAFKIRQRWWALAGHKGDKEKELVEPFSRCLAAFARRSQLPAVKKYRVAELLLSDLVGSSCDLADVLQSQYPGSAVPVTKTMLSLAQAADLSDEGLRWLRANSARNDSTMSGAESAIRIVQGATLSLDTLLKDSGKAIPDDLTTDALEALRGDLGGSSSQLDSLFLQCNRFRRSAAKAISMGSQPNSQLVDFRSQAVKVIAASVHLTSRYLGSGNTADMDAQALARHEQRISNVEPYVKSIIDSACLCSKMPLDGEPEDHWKIMDSLLQDGCSILRHFGEDSGTGRPLPPDLPQPLVKLSNAYWAVHLQLKSSDAQEKLVTQAMRRSVELIQARPRSEQESGLLVMKLERLAETLEGQDRIQSARDALLRCVQLLIDFGTLQDAVDLAKTRPLQHVFDSTDRTATLGRLLKTYHRSFLKSGVASASEDAFFDSEEISLAGRGLLLEWQLSLFLKLLSKNRAWDTNLNSSVQKISERLQDIYTVDRFPIRRRRVQILLLQLSQNHPEILPDSMRQTDVDGTSKDVTKGTEDQGLKRYESHLQALWKLKSSMQHSTLNDVVVHECCSAWQSILGSVTSWNNLSEFVDDIELWLAELQTAMDYLAARGEEYTCLPLLHQLTKALELEGSSDPSQLVAALCILALQLQRLGYSEKASAVLDKAEPLVTNKDVSTDAKLQWHIAFADYLVQTGDTDKCETHLSAAEDIARADQEFMDLAKPTTTLSGRVRFNRVLADACYVRSLVSEKLGHHKEAARYAKQCVILNRRIWAALESRSTPASAPPAANSSTDGSKAAFDPLSSLRDSKGAPLVTSLTHETLNGPRFWPLIPRLYQGLMQQSHVFANQGLLQEAVHVAEQAEKVAAAVSARSLLVENASRRAEYWAHSGRVDKAQKALQLPDEYLVQKHVCLVAYHLASASISHLTAEFQDESAAYGAIESLLKELRSPSFMKKFMTSSIGLEDLAEKLASVTLEAADAKKKPPTRAVRGRKPVSKPVPKAAPKAAPRKRKAAATSVPAEKPPAEVASEAGSVLSTLQAEALRRRALMHLAQEEIAKAFDLLNQAQVIELNAESNVSHQWVSYKATLLQSMSQLAADFTFNTLPESTIAFPAVRVKDRTASEGSAKRPTISPATIAKGARGKKASKTNFVATLREARERLIETHILCAQVGSTYSFQQASLALAQVTVLLSAVSGADLRGSLHPLYAAYMSEIPRSKALQLAQESLEVEKEQLSREDYLSWPKSSHEAPSQLVTASDFQKEYIDIIPKTWTAISLALNEDRDELYITRYEAGRSPFVLRLPMARHSSRDMDEEDFSFEDGKRDFDEIIELSDFSTRTAKDMTTKAARLEWWEAREALDNRLKELLINIENIWLGGFRGIFSQHPRDPTLQAKFRKSFETILDRHLPSRRGKASPKKAALDPRVLDLFIGLGDATDEELDLDEALMDLVYFVVDILQFQGEHNAYDEIDFDAMVIETLDALRAYHSAHHGEGSAATHTILILDKHLHIFPWESIPCLQSLSISRLPSLQALRERILVAKASTTEDARPGHHISTAAGGTSILNPSGDLNHTLKTLKPRLSNMRGPWTHISSRPPSESEFESSLRDQSLLLYFGHGSGAQFVRSKSVRRLYPGKQATTPGCATTLLFGCSSVHLTDNGIYEPSGMLASYLTAGAPAVLGMLWDVTDKDCDRVAVRTGELWGLWEETEDENEKNKGAGKGKGKAKSVEVEGARGRGRPRKIQTRAESNDDGLEIDAGSGEKKRGVSLDEALREARDTCVLRYLNGAAAVVYGIPVYLE